MSDYKRNPRGARRARKSMGRKAIVVLSLMMVLVLAAVGGTIAWLTDTSDTVTNTFTTAGIDIDLKETWNTDTNGDEKADSWSAQLVPGKYYKKDPVVSINTTETDVPIYLFVKFEEKNVTFGDDNKAYIIYDSALDDENSGWSQLNIDEQPTNVWYREWDPNTDKATYSWNLLNGTDGQQVRVNPALEKDEIPAKDSPDLPSLTFTAYGIQKEGFADAAAAWAEISKQ